MILRHIVAHIALFSTQGYFFAVGQALAPSFDTPATSLLPAGIAVTSSTAYLQEASDRYQNTIDVYTESDAAGNHFAARGEFDNLRANRVAAMDEISTAAPCLGITCITATFDPSRALWGGWYFLNGVLGPTDRQPAANWGDQPNAGYDLTGASALQLSARGAVGGEVVHFFAFGVGNTVPPYQPYPDSSAKVELAQGAVTLSTTWTQYQIPLTGLDLHYVLGGFGWVANAIEGNRLQPPITFYIDNIQYVKARPNDPRFLVSYETIKSSNPFDTVERNAAFVYDNAVALIASLAAGDLGHARMIADALVYAQANDRFFSDGRLRNAYQGGDIMLPPGWLPNHKSNTVRMPGWYDPDHAMWFEDETQVSTTTGNIAWAMLALLSFYEATHESKYLQSADALGNWVMTNTSDTRGNGGFTAGYDGWENGAVSGTGSNCASGVFVNGQCKRLYKATEHNIDLYSAFSRLSAAENSAQWAQAAQHARTFFLSMWDPIEGKFWTGTQEDGATVSKDVIPVDIQAWAIQALGSAAGPYVGALSYVETHHKTALGYGFKQNGGNVCGDNTWFEGTSQVAVSYLLAGNHAKWQSILDGIHSVQSSSGAVAATDGQCLNTGFILNNGQPWEYFPRAHVGATAWLSLAEMSVNPFATFSSAVPPKLSIIKTHTASFTQGQQNAIYTVTVSNATGAASTSGTVTMTETIPGGLTLVSMAGTGWNCSSNTCTRSDTLNGGGSYPAITVTVNVASNAASQVTNQASVSGGGSATANVTDPTTIMALPTCTFQINPTSASPAGTGGRSSVTVTTQSGCAWTGKPNDPWISNVTSSGVGSGTANYTVAPNTGAARTGTVTIAGQTLTIMEAVGPSDTTPPFGSFDTPTDNANNVVGAVGVTGWALDNVGVTKVEVYRDAVTGEAKGNFGFVFIGTAVFVTGARPDVQSLYPNYPNANRAGWGYQLLTNFLPNSGNGTFKLHTIAYDAAGNTVEIGTGKTIICTNNSAAKPFGTIDTPGQGETISGTNYVNFGWALTPGAVFMIPINGSTITVVVDGVILGSPTYNNFRSDIASLFPGYTNSQGAVGFFYLDTTKLTDGVHAISWNAYDNANRGEGLGSRYFTVANGGTANVPAEEEPPLDLPQTLPLDENGVYSVDVEEMERIELHTGAIAGHSLVNGAIEALPVGSTLKRGVFYWQLGPGFLGEHRLVLIRPDGQQVEVRVQIRPKTFAPQ